MDFMFEKSENPDIFPPKVIWCHWDSNGEFMDESPDPNDAKSWKGTGFLARYKLEEIEYDCRTEPIPPTPEWVKNVR